MGDKPEIVDARWHRTLVTRYKESWFDRHFRFSVPMGIALFTLSIVANFYAGVYATEKASNAVTDIILSNTPVYRVEDFFVWGVVALVTVIVALLAWHPKRIPFALHALSLFYFIRSAFVSMTHLNSFPGHVTLDVTGVVAKMFGGADLFFSGHTGAPFLMALMFWPYPRLRYLFLAWSVFFGTVVLLGHLHYTIDVFSAFFITYGIYHIALWLFPKERALFLAGGGRAQTSSP